MLSLWSSLLKPLRVKPLFDSCLDSFAFHSEKDSVDWDLGPYLQAFFRVAESGTLQVEVSRTVVLLDLDMAIFVSATPVCLVHHTS